MALLSPDAGAEPIARRVREADPAPAEPAIAEAPARRPWAGKRAADPAKQAAPVVEILRGNKVEERRLRASFDSGNVEVGGRPAGVLMDSR
jgi:hypothetical protein